LAVGAMVRIPAESRVTVRLQDGYVVATPTAVVEELEFPLKHAEANHEGNGLRECGSRNCGALASDLHRSVPSRNHARAVYLQPGGCRASVLGLSSADPVAVLEKAGLRRRPGDRGKGRLSWIVRPDERLLAVQDRRVVAARIVRDDRPAVLIE